MSYTKNILSKLLKMVNKPIKKDTQIEYKTDKEKYGEPTPANGPRNYPGQAGSDSIDL